MSLGIYKRGQGKYTRLGSGFAFGLIVALGCYRLYAKLGGTDLGLWVQVMAPVGVFAVLGGLVYWLMNKPSIADFMIAAEGEMKKVSWSSKKEITVSTTIVIVVVVLMSSLIGITDLIFTILFGFIFGRTG